MTPTTEYAVAFSAGASACMFIFERTYRLVRNRNGHEHTTFADQPAEYWKMMRENVTDPLGKVIEKQTEILERQVESNNQIMLKLVALDERTKR